MGFEFAKHGFSIVSSYKVLYIKKSIYKKNQVNPNKTELNSGDALDPLI